MTHFHKEEGFTPTPSFLMRSARPAAAGPQETRCGGFTLIELLAVVSIISLLSSVVLASLGEARAQARDAVRTQTADQYKKAVYFAYQEYGRYPNPPSPCSGHTLCCIGDADGDGQCGVGDTFEQHPPTNAMLDDFLPTLPGITSVNISGGGTFEGVFYCNSASWALCPSEFTIYWPLEDPSLCPGGESIGLYCKYEFE